MERLQYKASFKQTDPERFEIVANAGSLMDFGNEAVAIDISEDLKLNCHTEKPPLLADHSYFSPIGHIESIEVEDGRIIARGVFSVENEDAAKIKSSLALGFPWQASLGFSVNAGFKYSKGDQAKTKSGRVFNCNKKTTIATDVTIWECSVVLFGADNKTAVKRAAGVYDFEELKSGKMEELKKEPIEKQENQKEDLKFEAKQEELEELKKAAADKIRAAEKEELSRIGKIKEIAEKYNASAEIAAAIDSGESPESFELKVLRASFGKPPKIQNKIEEGQESKVFEAVALQAAGFNANGYSDAVLSQAEKLRGRDFRDIFEALSGFRPTYEQQKNADLWTAAASTHHLNSILTNSANAILLAAFEEQDNSFRDVFKVSSVPNFKTAERYRISSDFEFKKLENGEEMRHGYMDDQKWEVKAEVYGRQGELTYQDIVNGDALDVFGDIMRRFAYGANKAIQRKAWSLFLNPAADASSNAYYSAAHGNYRTASPLTAANLADAVAAFITRKRGFGADADELLGIKPELLIVPPSLKYTAELITKATTFSPAAQTVANYNPHSNYGWKVVTVTELEDATYGGAYSGTTWYLGANPNKISGFEIVFLNGQQAPTLRQNDVAIGRLGIQFDGHVDFGVGQQDWRALQQNVAS